MKEKCPLYKEEKIPYCRIFFVSWAETKLAILSCKFDDSEDDKNNIEKALDSYHNAFDKGRNFADAYLKAFLEESITATVYFNRCETKDIPEVIDHDGKLVTPITDFYKKKKESVKKKYSEYKYGALTIL